MKITTLAVAAGATAALFALLALSGCTDSHAAPAPETAPAALYKAGHGLQLSPAAREFTDVATAPFASRIPTEALVRTAKGDFVYVANGPWLLRTPVTVTTGDGLSFGVVDGLYEGDLVVVRGARMLWVTELGALNGGVGCADGH